MKWYDHTHVAPPWLNGEDISVQRSCGISTSLTHPVDCLLLQERQRVRSVALEHRMDALYDPIDHQVNVVLHVCPRISKHFCTPAQVTYRSTEESILLVHHPPSSDGSTARALAVQAMGLVGLVVGECVLALMSVITRTSPLKAKNLGPVIRFLVHRQ